MSHLSPETIARLVDEAPTADERSHVGTCRHCCEMLDEMKALRSGLRTLPAVPVPARAWDMIEARMERERSVTERRRGAVAALAEAGARIAAVVRGRYLQDLRYRQALRRVAYVAAAGVLVLSGGIAQRLGTPRVTGDGPQLLITDGHGGRIALSGGTATLVTASLAPAPATVDEAIARLRAAELLYHRALLDYSALRNPLAPTDIVARLATLDAIVATTGAALERAPADPVINTYHLAALAERQTLLGQIQ